MKWSEIRGRWSEVRGTDGDYWVSLKEAEMLEGRVEELEDAITRALRVIPFEGLQGKSILEVALRSRR